MRHQIGKRKLGRTTSHRQAMFRNMIASLVEHGRIKTTLPKAKELRTFADKMITLGKKDTLAARRQVFTFVRSKELVRKVFSDLAPRFAGRNGGYTRIIKAGTRQGDAAPVAYIEYLSEAFEEKKKPAKKKA